MIRPAAGADIPELAVLWERYRDEAADERCSTDLDWRRWILPRISAGDVRVGLVERSIVAYVAWQRTAPLEDGRRQLRIVELYVHPEGRGQRLGSGLLARAIDAARQRDCVAVELVSNVRDPAVQALALPFGFALAADSLRLPLERQPLRREAG